SIQDHGTDAFALVHQVEGVVDLVERHGVRDQVVDIDALVHVPVDDLRYVGTTTGATEGGAAPGTAGHQLEGARGNFLAGPGYTDDDTLSPALVCALECLAHDVHVADALEAVVHAAGHLHNGVDHVLDFF